MAGPVVATQMELHASHSCVNHQSCDDGQEMIHTLWFCQLALLAVG